MAGHLICYLLCLESIFQGYVYKVISFSQGSPEASMPCLPWETEQNQQGPRSACPVSLLWPQGWPPRPLLSPRSTLLKAEGLDKPGLSSRLSTAGTRLCTPPSSVHTLPCALPATHLSQLEFLPHMLLRLLPGQLFPFKRIYSSFVISWH